MHFKKLFLTASYCATFSWFAAAQTAPDNWFNLDQDKDKVMGVSSEKSYQELLKDKKPKKKIIVAVIDSGVEADHDDLKDIMWKNAKEVAGNALDDDNNGYADNIYGWNFIGGKGGKNVDNDNLEITRQYATLKSKTKRNKKEEKEFNAIKNDFESKQQKSKGDQQIHTMVMSAIATTKKVVGKEDITLEDLSKLDESNKDQQMAKSVMQELLKDGSLKSIEKDLAEWTHYIESQKYQYDTDLDTRLIVGDDYKNVNERKYGNNDVEGPDAGHGTHVAGIIAANRTNDKGMKGVADYVEIMAVRVVPNGDERDKDVANGIYYAVDNGAKIINMSFGKSYSPNKDIVDKAVQYAEKKGVLLVHAAGNDSKNIDENNNFPTKFLGTKGKRKKQAKNWLEIGALSWKGGADAPAEFSNYGKKTVDLFAPGVDIYSTVPDNSYEPNSGTSMAAPVTSGVAALVWAYYPELTVFQLREVLIKSATPMNVTVKKPGSQTPNANFLDLSITGGVVNAYRALELAAKMVGK